LLDIAGEPVGGVGAVEEESGFGRINGAFATEKNPLVVNSAGDDTGALVGGGFVSLEGVFKQGEVVLGVFVFEEERWKCNRASCG
jgi:hypothetical protein